jgi:hypothetical protein
MSRPIASLLGHKTQSITFPPMPCYWQPADAVANAKRLSGFYTATGRRVLAGVLSASPPASDSIFLRSRWNAMPVAVHCAKTLRLSRGSVFRRTKSNSERRSRARE